MAFLLLLLNCFASRTVVIPMSGLASPVSITHYFETDGKTVSVEEIGNKIGEFEITHRYWFLLNGVLQVGDRSAIIQKLNREIATRWASMAADVEMEITGCWINYAYPVNFLLVVPSCINFTLRGNLYDLKPGAKMPRWRPEDAHP